MSEYKVESGTRLKREDRKKRIVQGAARFFAEKGFGASTVELSKELGVTQPLLYKYFANKETLINAVYDEVYPVETRYAGWESILTDERKSLEARLVDFYMDYSEFALNYTFLRLVLWANLSRPELNRKYYAGLQNRVFPVIAEELVKLFDMKDADVPEGVDLLEVVQSLHGAIYHVGIRRWIHPNRLVEELRPLIELKVRLFLGGAECVLKNPVKTES